MTEIGGQDYRDAMACLGAAVSIVTTDGRAGRAGFTASAACSVTDDPPTPFGVPEPHIIGLRERDTE